MQLSPAPDDSRTGLFARLQSENAIVEMGIYRVMFGFRVRAGFCGRNSCELDWCAGANWSDVERLYSICRSIMMKRPEDSDCFAGLPRCSQVKPFFLDVPFTEAILRECGDGLEVVNLSFGVRWF